MVESVFAMVGVVVGLVIGYLWGRMDGWQSACLKWQEHAHRQRIQASEFADEFLGKEKKKVEALQRKIDAARDALDE